MNLSGLALALLERHRQDPGRPVHDVRVFGGMFTPGDLDRLDSAYRELETSGFVRGTGKVVRFFNHFLPLYQLTPEGLAVAEAGVGAEAVVGAKR